LSTLLISIAGLNTDLNEIDDTIYQLSARIKDLVVLRQEIENNKPLYPIKRFCLSPRIFCLNIFR
jgi:hypothetical protein